MARLTLLTMNKGFTLLEMLLVLFIISLFYVGILKTDHFKSYEMERKLLISSYAKTQNDAMYYREREVFVYDDLSSRFEIHFNARGNVNMAQTVEFLEWDDFVIWLGCGRIHER